MAVEGCNHLRDDGMAHKGACRVVDQNLARRKWDESFQTPQRRYLPRQPALHRWQQAKPLNCFSIKPLMAFADNHLNV